MFGAVTHTDHRRNGQHGYSVVYKFDFHNLVFPLFLLFLFLFAAINAAMPNRVLSPAPWPFSGGPLPSTENPQEASSFIVLFLSLIWRLAPLPRLA